MSRCIRLIGCDSVYKVVYDKGNQLAVINEDDVLEIIEGGRYEEVATCPASNIPIAYAKATNKDTVPRNVLDYHSWLMDQYIIPDDKDFVIGTD